VATLKPSSENTGLIVGLILALVGGLLIFLIPLTGMDGFDGGFALQFLGLFLLVSGLVTTAVFAYRARRLASMLRGQELLAHWVYHQRQKDEQALHDLAMTRSRNGLLLLIVSAFVVACTLLFVVIGFLEGEEENMPLFVAIMLGVLAVVAAFALVMPYVQYGRAMKSAGEAFIAGNGLYFSGVLHTWDAPLAKMESVELVIDGKEARLLFNLRSLSRTGAGGYQDYCVEVPVPPGEEATARRVEEHFRYRDFPV
jgi:hypothetical protein